MNYFTNPLTKEKLRELLKKAGLGAADLLRKSDSKAKELDLTAKTPSDELIALMVEFPQLMQRPIVEMGARAIVARPIDLAFDFIGKSGKS